ncbi:MAG: HD domain-containing protein [Candidatus Kaelpia aquatica]|nr:HD domain-containing protein [Candidatus Kaelpia aquatica]
MKVVIKHIEDLYQFLDNSEIYLVGGFLRDLILGKKRDSLDFDFASSGDVKLISKKFAESIGGSWVSLDDFNRIYRVVVREDPVVQYDFSTLRGDGIEEDLKSRDYTINALGLKVEKKDLDTKNLIDPCGGLDDLDKKIVRVISEDNLLSDPLRILRGMSIASYLDFAIEPLSYALLKKHSGLIKSIAGERISFELFRLFKGSSSYKHVQTLHELGVLSIILPGWAGLSSPDPGPYHHLPVDLHSIESLKQFESLLEYLADNSRVQDYLNEKIRENRRRVEILKLAILLHDIGKGPAYFIDSDDKIRFTGHEKLGREMVDEVALKLKLSKKESTMISDMVYYHLRPGCLIECIHESKKAKFRYFRDTASEAASVMLLSIADKSATCGELSDLDDIANHKEVLLDLIEEYFDKGEEIIPPKLIDGNDVMEALKIEPSRKVGQILKEIQERQALGEIKTREDAIGYIGNIKP